MNKLLNRFFIAIPLIVFYILSYYYDIIFMTYGIIITLFSIVESTNLENYKEIIQIISLFSSLSYFKLDKTIVLKLIGLNILSDSSQLLFGKFLRKYLNHKPFPKISPNKTTIGYLGGISITLLLNYFIKLFSLFNCIVIIISGIFGDLLFSYIKRNNNIKDYSFKLNNKEICILGEHGGILDRFDSIHFSLVFYYLTQIFIV